LTEFWAPSELSLSGALARIAEAMHALPMQDSVVRTLYGFLCDGKLVAFGDIANRNGTILQKKSRLLPEDWQFSLSEADFLQACGRRRVFRLTNTRNGPLFVINVRIIASELNESLSSISQSVRSTDAATVGRGRRRRTGLAGRPTSWDLIEHECRRRYADGERHPGKADESSTEWARVLIDWLKLKHPEEPVPTQKTVTNRLAILLRELGASAARNPDIRRPK
jgi:hypothetical protein